MTETKKFKDLGLSEQLLKAINKKGFEEPTEIQAMTIPVLLDNNSDIIAQAQTGTGKTAAFGLPLIDMIDENERSVQALVLVPTRELAIQVSEEINSLKGSKPLGITPIYGGQSIEQQLRRLKKGTHIVVGTPGRVIDHLKRKTLKLQDIDFLILDEADEMLNMGFIDDMEEIMRYTNQNKKTLLFSATMPAKIKTLAKKYMNNQVILKAKKENLVTSLTEQIYFEVKASDKFEALCRIIDIKGDFYGLVFCRTKVDVDDVSSRLVSRGYDAEAIHGDISQSQRERTLERFKKRKTNILVATDVAARGIDVNDLTHVINHSLPQDPESYIHRIGRTGRAGKTGTAITLITPSEYKRLLFIQRAAKTKIKKSAVPKVDDIIKLRQEKISHDLAKLLDKKVDSQYYVMAKQLLQDANPTEAMAAVLNYSFNQELNPDNYGKVKEFSGKEKKISAEGTTRLFVACGKKDQMNANKLANMISAKVNINFKDIDRIQVMDNFSFITVPLDKAEEIIHIFKRNGRDQRPLVSHAKSAR